MHRTICVTVGAVAMLHIAPCMAQQPNDGLGFAKKTVGNAEDFPASTGRFEGRRSSTEPNGPADLASATAIQSTAWRFCRQCGYAGETPKPFKAMGFHANFQPLGGTFRYRF